MNRDDDPGFFARTTVAVVGLGLMGGSLALALRGRCAVLLGIDPDERALQLARECGAVDEASSDPAALLPRADLIVLAAPVRAILRLLEGLPRLHPGSPVVLDLGSTKTQITAAMQALPERFDPLGGHPMCGKETGGLENADPALYRDAPFALTPLPRSTPRARALCRQLVRAVGARPLWLDPAVHDRWVAATSHLPYLAASALASAVPSECAPMAGPGFRSTSRLAATPPGMMRDVLETNRGNILASLQSFREALDHLEALLAREDFDALEAALALGAEHRKEILENNT